MPSKPTKAKKQTTNPADPKEELAKKLREVFPTVVGEFSDQLKEREALNVACDTVRTLLEEWGMRLGEIDEEGEEDE